jgi:hypothetical protein
MQWRMNNILFPLLSLSSLPYSMASDLIGNPHIVFLNFVPVNVFQNRFLGRWCNWLRHCATSRKVAGSILDGVTGTFQWYNPSGRTLALGLTQPLTEMSTRNMPWGGGSRVGHCVGLTTLPPSCGECLEILEPEPSGILRIRPGLYRDCLTFYITEVVEECNLSMARWRNVTEGENAVRARRRTGFPFIKMMSYICYYWTTKWRNIFATVETQNDVLYLLLLNHKIT